MTTDDTTPSNGEKPTFTPSLGDLILTGRVMAGIDLLRRAGAKHVDLSHEEDPIRWTAAAVFRGTRVASEKFPYPAHAVEDLLSRTVNGGLCIRCGRSMLLDVEFDGMCSVFVRAEKLDDPQTYSYVRDCDDPENTNDVTAHGHGRATHTHAFGTFQHAHLIKAICQREECAGCKVHDIHTAPKDVGPSSPVPPPDKPDPGRPETFFGQ